MHQLPETVKNQQLTGKMLDRRLCVAPMMDGKHAPLRALFHAGLKTLTRA
jgi:hypothetical protein